MRQEMAIALFLAWVSAVISGESLTIQRFNVAWSISTPRSAMISSRSRYDTP